MHPKNPYAKQRPDFKLLAQKYPEFKPFVKVGYGGNGSGDGDGNGEGVGYANINWKGSDSLRALTGVLLKEDWRLDVDLPKDRLCPTIPNRLDYIFHLLDLRGHLPRQDGPLRVLDIGTGSVAIYPLLIHRLCPDSIIIATEKDLESLEHAKTVLRANNIPPESITLLAPTGEVILFPLLDDEGCEMDITMCNPPFFASLNEMQEGRELKVEEAHTAHTGSDNEMVTNGGEVGFISQMIDESRSIGTRCTWYTSLVGRYSSLPKLITKLQTTKITNYYVLSIRPAKTVRWIIIWSFTPIRLPDSLTRPDPSFDVDVPSSYYKLLPLANTVRHVVRPHRAVSVSVSEMKVAILDFLTEIRLYTSKSQLVTSTGSQADTLSDNATNGQGATIDDPDQVNDTTTPTPITTTTPFEINLVAYSNTWSRAARRKSRLATSTLIHDPQSNVGSKSDTKADNEPQIQGGKVRTPLLKATLRIMDGQVEMDWTYGMDRGDFDSLWKSILANSGLVSRGQKGEPALRTGTETGTGTGTGAGVGAATGVSKRATMGQDGHDSTYDKEEHENNLASKKPRTEL